MKVKIDADVRQQIQSLTTINLQERDYYFFVDWLLRVGVSYIKATLENNPELTLGNLAMMQFRNSSE